MVCTVCGAVAQETSGRCAACDSEIPRVDGAARAEPSLDSDADTSPGVASTAAGRSPAGRATALLTSGQKFGSRYTIIRQIGEGGMGAVYQAWDDSLGVAVAFKFIKFGDA